MWPDGASFWYDASRTSAITTRSSRFANSLLGKFDTTLIWRAWKSECFSVSATGVELIAMSRYVYEVMFSLVAGIAQRNCALDIFAMRRAITRYVTLGLVMNAQHVVCLNCPI